MVAAQVLARAVMRVSEEHRGRVDLSEEEVNLTFRRLLLKAPPERQRQQRLERQGI